LKCKLSREEIPKGADWRAILLWTLLLGFTWDLGFGIWDFVRMIRVIVPHHLRTLARVGEEVQLDLNGSATICSVLDALEQKYPMLQGTIRDHGTLKRRPMVRFFVCGEDLSLESADTPLPDAITNGSEPFFIMGAIAGG
jgi:molybdopterin synthase sulfur carrier subunit